MKRSFLNNYRRISVVFSLLWLISNTILAQISIKGTVTDETNSGMPGVSIVIKNTTRGTTSAADGTFSLNVSDQNAILIFSFTGYESQEVKVGNQSTINIQMKVDTKTLDEMVVIGYGTQRKVDLTGSVASVTNKEFANRPYTNADQILSGRVTGVLITNRSGDPGAPIDVRIRGVGTVGNNQPLWVIDGVPIVQTTNITVNTGSSTETNPLAGINPSDIESMDILKDASATAIYGARAANGVVIVTTKRGKAGRTTASYDGYYGVQQVARNRKLDVLGVSDYIALQQELGRDYSSFSNQPFVDWQDEIFRTGGVRNHNLSVRGGTENINFNIVPGTTGRTA